MFLFVAMPVSRHWVEAVWHMLVLLLLTTLLTSMVRWFYLHFQFYPGVILLVNCRSTIATCVHVRCLRTSWVLSPPGYMYIAALVGAFIAHVWHDCAIVLLLCLWHAILTAILTAILCHSLTANFTMPALLYPASFTLPCQLVLLLCITVINLLSHSNFA